MNDKASRFIKNFSYTLTANIVSLLVSTLVVLIVPKLIGVEEYGYLQLYLFYAAYVGFLQFGWTDGIYLRYGGREYKNLNKELFFSQFWSLTMSQLLIAFIIMSFSTFFISDKARTFILIMVAICMIIMGTRAMLLFILQATNRIKEYAHITLIAKLLYFLLIAFTLIIGIRDYKLLIIADLAGKFISLAYAMYFCRDIVFRKVSTFYFSFKEVMDNVNVGIKLMFANIASLLIIGTVRFGIERAWDVVTFGKVSLMLSVSNLMMVFINAIGIVMFPVLRRTEIKKLPNIYVTMRDFLMVFLLGMLITYYPLRILLAAWLPKYAESLMYMSLLFPIFIYEGKMALLINTYLKSLRKEKLMLHINIISLVLSLIITFITTILFKDLTLSLLSIVILLAFRSILAEMYLSKILEINLTKDIVLELTVTTIFIVVGWYLNSWLSFLIHSVTYLMYIAIKRRDINITIKNLKLLIKP